MRDITVKFIIYDEDEERLRKITEEYNKQGFNFTKDEMFKSIMFTGSKHDIDEKFKFHEWKLGLREDYK